MNTQHHDNHDRHDQHHHPHIVGPKVYAMVFAALMVLMVMTVIASFFDLGPFNLPIALMHVGSLYAIAATAGTVLLVVLVAFDVTIVVAGTACVIVTTLIRLGSVRFGWSLPEQRALGSWRVWRRA